MRAPSKPRLRQVVPQGHEAAAKDRDSGRMAAAVIDNTDAATLQGFVTDHATVDAMVYTDEHIELVGA